MSKTNPMHNSVPARAGKAVRSTIPGILLVSASLLFSVSAKAQNIANWTFNNLLTGSPGLFNTIGLADFSPSVPIHSFNSSAEYFGEGGWPTGGINTSMYLEFSLVPLPGYQLDISSLVLRMRRSNTGSPAGAGPNNWSLRSSRDGFTTDIAAGSMTHAYADYTVSPGSGFLNLYLPIVFRLYGYNTSINNGGSSRLVIDNITVKGIGYLLSAKLGAINANLQDGNTTVNYTVYNTEKNNQYSIEKSSDGIHFNAVHTIVESNNSPEQHYSYTESMEATETAQQWYYRVKLVNLQQGYSYSSVVLVKKPTTIKPLKTGIQNNQLFIIGSLPENGLYQAELYNVNGQLLMHTSFTGLGGYHSYNIPLTKPVPAACVIHISGNTGYVFSSLLAINK